MADTPITDGRDPKKGTFLPGNTCSRVPRRRHGDGGSSLRQLRERIIASWKSCDGDGLLRTIAKTDPKLYCRLILSALPKGTDTVVEPRQLTMVVSPGSPPKDWQPPTFALSPNEKCAISHQAAELNGSLERES